MEQGVRVRVVRHSEAAVLRVILTAFPFSGKRRVVVEVVKSITIHGHHAGGGCILVPAWNPLLHDVLVRVGEVVHLVVVGFAVQSFPLPEHR